MNTSTVISELLKQGKTYFTLSDVRTIVPEESPQWGAVYSGLSKFRVGRGQYCCNSSVVPPVVSNEKPVETPAPAPHPKTPQAPVLKLQTAEVEHGLTIPAVDSCYVPWGDYDVVYKAIKSRIFFPIFIAGVSGNGKTVMVEQACAKAKREYVRIQISKTTEEDDLIGGFRLINGETVFYKGPVVRAYESGAVVLLDEVDRGSNNLLCLQGIMEGKPILIKKTGETIYPKTGFTVVATANTKGRGSSDGRYSGAMMIDDAFLERFVITIEQEFPSLAVERNILLNHMERYGVKNDSLVENLLAWAHAIRKTFEDGGVDEVISTRRLCHIIQTYSVYDSPIEAIRLCVNRFDRITRDTFVDLFTKVAPITPAAPVASGENVVSPTAVVPPPF